MSRIDVFYTLTGTALAVAVISLIIILTIKVVRDRKDRS